MKKITKIEVQQKNKDRFNIYLDEKYEFSLSSEVILKYNLKVKSELEDDFITDVLKAEEVARAFNYCLLLLGRSPKSEHEIRKKLTSKEYDDDTVENVIERLYSYKYLDDNDYSERFINNKINFSKDGKLKIKQALYLKGVDKSIINDKLKEIIDDNEELKRATELAKKKLRTMKDEEYIKKRSKLYNFIVRKGFDYDTAGKAVNFALKENDDNNYF